MSSPLRLLSSLAVENKDEQFHLLDAVTNDDYNTSARLLIEQQVNPNAENHRFSVVCIAAREGRERILNLLVEHGGDPDQFDMSDHMWLRRPIHWSASNGHLECLKILLSKGVDINSQDSDGRTALHWAATYGRTHIVEYLLREGAKINIGQVDGFTPLHAATCLGHTDVCKLLICHGANINLADRDSWTALHTAACYGYLDVVDALLDAGAELHNLTCDHETPFHVACSSGHVNIVRKLFECGSDINAVNVNGYTPFHLAVYYNRFDIARFLVTTGADMNTASNTGQTPVYLASLRGEENILSLMMEAGCRVTIEEVSVAPQASSLLEQMEFLAINPRPLRDLCCIKIRHILGPTMVDDVPVLPIPETLKGMISLEHCCK